jgi:molybdopterin-guanine dinucleotide biosynthesis protein B
MLLINAIGFSNSGKTTLLEVLARHYSSQGKKVAVIKDIHSEEYQPDKEESDTWRYAQAGAHLVVGRGVQDTVFHWRNSMKFLEIVGKISADILIVEGFKDEQMPRIVCAADKVQLVKLVDRHTFCIAGVISDTIKEYEGIPVFNYRKDLDKIILLAEEKSARWA